MLDGIINWDILDSAIHRAFYRLVSKFEDLQIEQIEAIKWRWFGKTVRSSGTVVTSPRDILDTGQLKDSLEVSSVDKFAVKYEYVQDYAGLVHQGFDGAGNSGSPKSYPARPWVTTAYEENDLLEIFKQYLEEELR